VYSRAYSEVYACACAIWARFVRSPVLLLLALLSRRLRLQRPEPTETTLLGLARSILMQRHTMPEASQKEEIKKRVNRKIERERGGGDSRKFRRRIKRDKNDEMKSKESGEG